MLENSSACSCGFSLAAGEFEMARRPKPWFREARGAWFVTLGGTQHNLGPDKKQAFDRFYELMRQPHDEKIDPRSVVGIIDSFLEWVEKHRSPDTFEWYRYRLQRFAEKHATLTISDLRPFHVQKWVDSYPNLSVTSRRNYLRTIKRCLAWAVRQGYLDKNPLAALEVPSGERKEVAISAEEYEKLLSYCRDENFLKLVVVTWETGCRPQELLRVEARHVDLANQRWVFPQKESKGKRAPRIVYLSEKAVEITAQLMAQNPVGPLFRNTVGKPWSTDAVNCSFDRVQVRMAKEEMTKRGLTLDPVEIADFMKTLKATQTVKGKVTKKSESELREEAKRKLTQREASKLVPRYSLYALRHSWATKALKSGLDGLTVAILMGHSDPSTLARVYQHLSHDPQHLLSQARRANTGTK